MHSRRGGIPGERWGSLSMGTGWGPCWLPREPKRLIFVAEKTMVYGRYNELVHGDYFMVYKPTFTSLGGPSCRPTKRKWWNSSFLGDFWSKIVVAWSRLWPTWF